MVYLTGGEVLTHPDFEKIYIYLKTKGVFVVILTSLSLLNEQHIELFKKYPPLRITASIYAMSSNSFKTVTGLNGEKYKTLIDNVITLKKIRNKYFLSDTYKSINKIGLWGDC